MSMEPVDMVPMSEMGPINQIAGMPRDLAIVKMDNENMMALAAAHPRDYAVIQKDLVAQLQAFPEFAKSARYAKPVGREEKCPKCGARSEYQETCPKCKALIPMKIARGLSIRAAEALRLSFGFTKLEQTAEEINGGEAVQLTTTLVDFQRGNITRKSFPVSKTYKDRYGRQKRIPDDRFYDLTVKAKASIQARDAIMTLVPPGMKAALEAEAIRAQQALMTDEAIRAMLAKFATKDVTQAMLESCIGKPIAAFTNDDRTTLLGIWTALEDGEMTVAEAFGGAPEDAPPKSKSIMEKLRKPTPQPPPPDVPSPPQQKEDQETGSPFEQNEQVVELPPPIKEIPRVSLPDIGQLAEGAEFKCYGEISRIEKRVSTDGNSRWWDITMFSGPIARTFTWLNEKVPEIVRTGEKVLLFGKVGKPFQGRPQFTATSFERE